MAENFDVRNEEIENTLREMGQTIGDALPEGWGFTLQIYSFGENGSTFYISNADRQDMIAMMKEFIKKEEAR